MFVTAWNRYAWDYLTAIRDVEHVFPVHVQIPSLDATGTSELLLHRYGPETPAFVETGAAGRVKTVDVDRRSVTVPGDRSVTVPVPALNLEYLTARSNADAYGDVEAVVFEKLTYLSDGNPGLACRLWERSIRDGEIAPAFVEEVETTLDLNDDQAFLLELMIAKEVLTVPTLQDVLVNVPVDRALGTLIQQGVLSRDGDRVSLVPERLNAVVDHLRGRQLIW